MITGTVLDAGLKFTLLNSYNFVLLVLIYAAFPSLHILFSLRKHSLRFKILNDCECFSLMLTTEIEMTYTNQLVQNILQNANVMLYKNAPS